MRFCDAFNIPLLTFVDVPGFLPGQLDRMAACFERTVLLSLFVAIPQNRCKLQFIGPIISQSQTKVLKCAV